MLENIQQLIEEGVEIYIIEEMFNLTGNEMDAILDELGL